MSGDIVFYRLSAKILDRAEDVPENAKQVMYYSLAIGHHVGVFDCFKPVLRCPAAFYQRLVGALPAGEAKRKFDGINRFGEITVDQSHVALLGTAIEQVSAGLAPDLAAWFAEFSLSLAAIQAEPAIYMMGRRL